MLMLGEYRTKMDPKLSCNCKGGMHLQEEEEEDECCEEFTESLCDCKEVEISLLGGEFLCDEAEEGRLLCEDEMFCCGKYTEYS